MLNSSLRRFTTLATILFIAQVSCKRSAFADAPPPRLAIVDPPGGKIGSSVVVHVSGVGLEGLTALRCDEPRIRTTALGDGRFTLQIPDDVPPGLYDLRTLGANGLSSPRSFFVSPRDTLREAEPKGAGEPPQAVKLDVSICGRIEPAGDVDEFRFHARAGQRVVIECWAERLDSKLRAVLELEDERGRRVASSQGYAGLDPLIDVRVPADGDYVVRIFDLTYTGSPEHAYRLDIDTGPRVEFAWPNVVERDKTTRVTLFGRNLVRDGGTTEPPLLDQVEVDVTPPVIGSSFLPRAFARLPRFAVEEFPVDFPGSPLPVLLGTTDVSVLRDNGTNHQPASAQELPWPCEVAGRLEAGDEKDWYLLRARRGDVAWLELFGERIGAPVDLDLAVLDALQKRELLHLTDCLEDPRDGGIATSHSDPSGRWVAPATGDYLILVRNVIGGASRDPRRIYRLSVRREEADFQLLAIPGGGREPGGWNVPRGGRALIELVALRRRGLSQPIRVTASGLPDGFESPDVWFGPDVDRVPMIVSSSRDARFEPRDLTLTGRADLGGVAVTRLARGAAVLSIGPPTASARLTSRITAALGPEPLCVVTATPSRTEVSQGTVIDVQVQVDVAQEWKAGPVALTGIGIPADRSDHVTPYPSDRSKLWFSIQVPERLPAGPYTFAIRADSVLTTPGDKPGEKPKTRAITAYSNALSIEVSPGAFDLWVDPKTPRRIKRGEVVQLTYRAFRRNGFIGKIRAELHAPEGVSGLRARGVTFVGQTDTGVIQIAASDDAPLGRQPTLRLEALGTVEDEPIHHVGCFIDMEIIP
jgi:hypothetical protein